MSPQVLVDYMEPKKLIETAMPVKEISLESVRDKSIRHGHISTLHLWWARRPLPVCRAVVFASLVPDPLDENCSQEFKDAVKTMLCQKNNGIDTYKPYNDIPITNAVNPMEDNLRNRLLMFIGKFSETFIQNNIDGKKTSAKDTLDASSLIKWDNKNNEEILNIARKLIWVAHNPKENTLTEFEKYYNAIKKAENELYEIPDRHIKTNEVNQKETNLKNAIDDFLNRMPKVFDPFAGGGAIPLEASRLGCRSYGNDINPVAHIIQKASLEFPQKYGKPITYTKNEFIKLYGEDEYKKINPETSTVSSMEDEIRIENRLAFDVEYFAKKLLKLTEQEIGHLYPVDENGNKLMAYYWVKIGNCANPTCKAKIPLLNDFNIVKRNNFKIHLFPIINGTSIKFIIKKGNIKNKGWLNRGNIKCPCCGNITTVKQLKEQFLSFKIEEKIIFKVVEISGKKIYKLPDLKDIEIISKIEKQINIPIENMQRNSAGGDTFGWGYTKWGQLFSDRQIKVINTFISNIFKIKNMFLYEKEYSKVIDTYLSLFFDRLLLRMTSFGVWHTGAENVEHLYGRQAISMKFRYPEGNPFCKLSSASALNQLKAIILYIKSESININSSNIYNCTSGEKKIYNENSFDATITDPPYYDAIAYSDLSDFFYVWLKRILIDIYPSNFSFPLTPKSDECTALKYHHN